MAEFPLPKFHFKVEWDNVDNFQFTEVSGLDFESDMLEYRDGADQSYYKQKRPGLKKTANITLKRGMFKGARAFYDWYEEASNRTNLNPKDVTIKLLDEAHEPVITWTLTNAWAIKFQGTDLKGDANEVAIETLELAHEGMTIDYS